MLCVCFFFQAEDGIRDIGVTGVQTCALPIFFSFIVSVVLLRFLAMGRNSSCFLFFIVASVWFCFLITGQSSSRFLIFHCRKRSVLLVCHRGSSILFLFFIVSVVRFCFSAAGKSDIRFLFLLS